MAWLLASLASAVRHSLSTKARRVLAPATPAGRPLRVTVWVAPAARLLVRVVNLSPTAPQFCPAAWLAQTWSIPGVPATVPWFFTVTATPKVPLANGALGVRTRLVTTKSEPPNPGTWTGLERLMVVPSPSWPQGFQPHAHRVPSVLSARLCHPPPAMEATPSIIRTGVDTSGPPPLPTSPCRFSPHAHSVPSVLRARVPHFPAATATTPLRTCTGYARFRKVPSPSCPSLLLPHAQRLPSVLIARLW